MVSAGVNAQIGDQQKPSSRPIRVRVLPPGPVGSEFDPTRNFTHNNSLLGDGYTNRDTQTVHYEPNPWRIPHTGSIENQGSDLDSSAASSLSAVTPKNVVWNWRPRDGFSLPESTDDALQIIPGEN